MVASYDVYQDASHIGGGWPERARVPLTPNATVQHDIAGQAIPIDDGSGDVWTNFHAMTMPYGRFDDWYSLHHGPAGAILDAKKDAPKEEPAEEAKSSGSYRLARRLQRRKL